MLRFAILVFISLGVVSGQAEPDDYEEEVPSTHVPQLLSSSSSIQATIGESVTFRCDVEDLGDFVLLWKKGKQRILFAGDMRVYRDSRFKIVDKTSLHISSIQPKDSGEYTCQISTSPLLELFHTLDVLYPPSIKPRPRDGVVTVKEGETVTLSCDATGNPPPTISWKHHSRIYDSSEGTDFRINSAQKEDSGEYECIADNKIGEPASSVITVEVVSAPKVYPNPSSGLLVVKEGEPISISCNATGDPKPVISWKIPGGEKAQKLRDESKVVISMAERTHAGSYECIANNSLGIFTSTIIRVQVLYPPEVKVPNTWIHSGEGHTVNLSCIVRGEPAPSVMWKKNDGSIITSDSHYRLKSSGHLHMLQIDHLNKEDFGRYTCVASNSLSSGSENVHIIGTPQVPIFTSKPHTTQATKYTVSWTVKSHTSVDEYSLMYRKKANNAEWETKTISASDPEDNGLHTQMFQLSDLVPSTSYEVVVTAKNTFGWSKQSEALVFTTKNEVITDPPPTIEETTTAFASEEPVANDKKFQADAQNGCAVSTYSAAAMSLLAIVMCYQHLH